MTVDSDRAVPSRRTAVTIGVLLVSCLASMEVTVVSTAVPTMVKALGGLQYYSWVFTSYMLTITVSVPLWGKLSDLYGRKRIYCGALLLFVLGSGLSGQADSMGELVVWRLFQGLGAGALTPVGQAILADLYSLESRAKIQTYFSAAFGVASAVGPIIGGFVTEHFSWRWVFYLNLPLAISALALIGWGLREGRTRERQPLDWMGAFFFTGSFSLFFLWLDLGNQWGWGSPRSYAAILGFTIFLSGLGAVEKKAVDPLLPLLFFKDRMLLGSLVVSLFVGTGLYGALTYLPLYFQSVQGRSASAAGGALTPLLLSWMLVSMASPRLVLKIGYRPVIFVGAACMALSFWRLIDCGAHSSLTNVILAGSLLGMAGGLCFSPLMIGAQSVVQSAQMGAASAAVTFFRSVGGALGMALMGAALASAPESAELGLDRAFTVGVVASVLAGLAVGLLPGGTAEEIQDEALHRHNRAVTGLTPSGASPPHTKDAHHVPERPEPPDIRLR